jgi:hypothetical protein
MRKGILNKYRNYWALILLSLGIFLCVITLINLIQDFLWLDTPVLGSKNFIKGDFLSFLYGGLFILAGIEIHRRRKLAIILGIILTTCVIIDIWKMLHAPPMVQVRDASEYLKR